MTTNKKIDLATTIILLAVGAFIWYALNLKPLIGGAIFTLLPAFYLTARKQKNAIKIFWAAIIMGGLMGFFFSFWETFNKAWVVTRLVFQYKVLGILPIDDTIGFILMTILIVVFYEHFLDDEKIKKISNNFIWALLLFSFLSCLTIWLFVTNQDLLRIKYAYFWGGMAAVIFSSYFIFHYQKFLFKFVALSAFFFFVWFVAEMVALKTGGWTFPGNYIGTVSIFNVNFPVEELFFWMGWYALTITAAYELSIDDMR